VRICLLTNEYPPEVHGGLGTFCREIGRGLVGLGHEVTVLGTGPRAAVRDDGGVRVVRIRASRIPLLRGRLDRRRLRAALESEVAAGRVEIAEVPDYQGLLPFSGLACPVVVRLHGSATLLGDYGIPGPSRLARLRERATLAAHHRWIAPTRHVLEETRRVTGLTPERAEVIPHPALTVAVEGGTPAPERKGGLTILYVGTLWEALGPLEAAAAARRVLARREDVHVVFVGAEKTIRGRPSGAAIRDAVGEELSRRVVVTGRLPRAEALAWMARADVFLYPSPREAFGLVYLEAMAQDLPIVGPDSGVGPEILDHGRTALLAPADDPDGLAAAVERLLDDPGLAARLTENARRDLRQRFSLETCLERTLAFYSEAIAAEGGNP